jgi:hypothetical protein
VLLAGGWNGVIVKKANYKTTRCENVCVETTACCVWECLCKGRPIVVVH